MVLGHARHGKDTVGNILRDEYGLDYCSSSEFCADKFIRKALEDKGIVYNSLEECLKDRVNHRAFWFDQIVAYNDPHPWQLVKDILEEFDIYCGIRNWREFIAAKNMKLFDYSIWVDASTRFGPEPKSSMNIEPWMCDFILDNNGSFGYLRARIAELMDRIKGIY